MAGRIDARLAELGVTLPAPAPPAANYVPFTRVGEMVFISGQIPKIDGRLHGAGRLGDTLSIEDGAAIARMCGLNILAQAKVACDGDLDRVIQVVKLGGFVACTADFFQHPEVVNGASDLMIAVFGDAGRHARFAVGAPSLPRGAVVEVEAILQVR